MYKNCIKNYLSLYDRESWLRDSYIPRSFPRIHYFRCLLRVEFGNEKNRERERNRKYLKSDGNVRGSNASGESSADRVLRPSTTTTTDRRP
jgi:hypothetical protein